MTNSLELTMIKYYENALEKSVKPSSCNRLEAKVEEILLTVKDFFKNPTHDKKETILRHVAQTSVSETDLRGVVVAYSDRFSLVLSLLYLYGYYMRFPELKLYVYRCLVHVAITEHALEILHDQLNIDVPKYVPNDIVYNLYIYYWAYRWFRYSYETDNVDTIYIALFDVANSIISNAKDKSQKIAVFSSVMQIIYDLALTTGYDEIDCYHSYTSSDISLIFSNLAEWIKECPGLIGYPWPFFTRLSVILASMVTRLRNKLDNFPVVKYISDINLGASFSNKQVWLHEMDKLNDSREGKVLEEILSEKEISYPWQKLLKLDIRCYVGCFSRNVNTAQMKMYGNNGLSYKNDNIATKLAPISIDDNDYPVLARVLSYDVSYSKETVRNELRYVSELIEKLPIDDDLKALLFTMYVKRVQYSAKDSAWEQEQERRYVIEMYDEPKFIDATVEDGFIKIDTLLYLRPDFLLSCSDCFHYSFEKEAIAHIKKDVTVPCSLCMDCLELNFNVSEKTCRQCGSTNIQVFNT